MQEMRQRKFDKGLEPQQGMRTFPHRDMGPWGILEQECEV